MNVQDLKEKYKLTPVICQLVQDKIIQIYTFNVRPTDQAIAIILGGQPGAGKGELITIATKMLAGNLVICNADEYRDFHPLSDEIKANYEEFYPDITVDYSQPWNNGLRAFCEQQGLSYVMETTFTSGARMNETISDMKSKGYRVVILLLAVNERFSLLGTYLRYLEMKNLSGYGRRVSKKIHDEKYGLVPSTLKAVQEAGLYDEIQIYKRKPVEENHIGNGIELIATNPIDPLTIYLTERDKPWSHYTRKYFVDCCQKVASMMNSRRDAFKKEQFLKNLGLKTKR